MSSVPTASVEVVRTDQTRFTNAVNGDMAIYTASPSQHIHIGTTLNAPSALSIQGSTVTVPTTLDIKGVVTHNGTIIIDDTGNFVGVQSEVSLPLAGGAMVGQIQGYSNDSAISPAFSWVGDSNSGIYNKQVGQIAVSCAGSDVAVFKSSGSVMTTNLQTKGIRLSN